MKTCREQLEERFNDNIDYYKRQEFMETTRKLDRQSYRVAEIIDAMLSVNNEGIIDINAHYDTIILTFHDKETSRKFVERILDRFKLDKIEKSFYTYTDKVSWFYRCYVKNGHQVELKIHPCEPSPECTPVKVSEGYTKQKWVCSQTGKEL